MQTAMKFTVTGEGAFLRLMHKGEWRYAPCIDGYVRNVYLGTGTFVTQNLLVTHSDLNQSGDSQFGWTREGSKKRGALVFSGEGDFSVWHFEDFHDFVPLAERTEHLLFDPAFGDEIEIVSYAELGWVDWFRQLFRFIHSQPMQPVRKSARVINRLADGSILTNCPTFKGSLGAAAFTAGGFLIGIVAAADDETGGLILTPVEQLLAAIGEVQRDSA